MDIAKLMEILGEKKEAFLQSSVQCGNARELQELAAENGISLDKDEAAELFETMEMKSDALSDEELDSVAGGGIYEPNGRLWVTVGFGCGGWVANTSRLWLAVKGQCGSCNYYGGDTFKIGTCGNSINDWKA